MKKKVEIIISDKYDDGKLCTYACEDKKGKNYIRVDYTSNTYGGGCPCNTEEEVQKAISNAINSITLNGDTYIIADKRIKISTLGDFSDEIEKV